MRILPYLFIALLVFGSCSNDDTNVKINDALLGTWELKTVISLPDLIGEPPQSSKVSITFLNDEGSFIFNGNSTCNQYGGQIVKLTKDEISFSEIFATEIACSDALLTNFEEGYFQSIAKVNQYKIENNTLILSFSGVELTFEKDNN